MGVGAKEGGGVMIKLYLYCLVCGKTLKHEAPDVVAKDRTHLAIEPCPVCIKSAEVNAHVDGMLEHDRQLEKARKRRDG